MSIGCRIEGFTVNTYLFLSRSAAVDFAFAQALPIDAQIRENAGEEDADPDADPHGPLQRADDGNYHWDDTSYPGWGQTVKTQQSTLAFDCAAAAPIFASSCSD